MSVGAFGIQERHTGKLVHVLYATDAVLTPFQREAVPAALLWPNWESCGYDQGCALDYIDPQPISSATCHQGSTPPYSISILDAQDASIVTKWATVHNIKLTVKNTGF